MHTTRADSTAPVTRSPSRLSGLARIQAASGLAFAVFGSLHIANTVLGAFGPEVYNAYQRALRPIYQYPLVEMSLILIPLAVHAATGIARMRQRKGRATGVSSAKLRAHRYAGWFLLAVILGHIAATRGPALLRGAFPEFEGVAFTFQFMPGFFYPYYTLLALAGALHMLIGVPLALARLGVWVPPWLVRGTGARVVLGFVCASVLLGVAGLGGLLFPIEDLATHPFAVAVRETFAALFGAASD